MDKSKEGTARQTVFTTMNVMNSYTLEASYYGFKDSKGRTTHFMVEDYESCGKTLLATFFYYLPGHQRGLLCLVESVVKAFSADFPENLRTDEIKRIN